MLGEDRGKISLALVWAVDGVVEDEALLAWAAFAFGCLLAFGSSGWWGQNDLGRGRSWWLG